MDNRKELVILDDDELIIELIQRTLSKSDFNIRGFTTQEDCLGYLSDTVPTHLFVDMNMPESDGLQFITQLKNQGFSETTKIFLCSGVPPEVKVRTEVSAMNVEIIVKDNVCDIAWLNKALDMVA